MIVPAVVPAGGEPVLVWVIVRRPDTIVHFGETRIHSETVTFALRASAVANPRPGISLAWPARPWSSRASRMGAILTGSYGRSTLEEIDEVRSHSVCPPLRLTAECH